MDAPTATCYPPWVVLHVPHDAVDIPAEVRDQFMLDEAQLQQEVLRMTDHCTAALFAGGTRGATLVRAPVSRLVVDCHSFPGRALPYGQADAATPRPDICVGTDAVHTSSALAAAFTGSFAQSSWRVAVNDPFAGALVPASRYRRDARVQAVMVEVNRGLYMD